MYLSLVLFSTIPYSANLLKIVSLFALLTGAQDYIELFASAGPGETQAPAVEGSVQ